MTQFVNKGEMVDHYHPAGHDASLRVESGQVVDVGDLKVVEADDCYLVGDGDDVRAWPKSRWEMQGAPQTRSRPAPKEKDTKSEKPAETPAE